MTPTSLPPSVFELVEHSSEEVYYPIGLFRSIGEAKAIIDKADKDNTPVYSHTPSYEGETLHILERPFGLSENGGVVFIANRTCEYNDADDLMWKTVVVMDKLRML